eukprot:940532_1
MPTTMPTIEISTTATRPSAISTTANGTSAISTTMTATTNSPTAIITTFEETDDDTDDYSSDSYDDSYSSDDMFAAVSNGALLEDEEDDVYYNANIKFSNATLMNVCGLLAVFVFVNVFLCCVCC